MRGDVCYMYFDSVTLPVDLLQETHRQPSKEPGGPYSRVNELRLSLGCHLLPFRVLFWRPGGETADKHFA